jgi:hypothetical protein
MDETTVNEVVSLIQNTITNAEIQQCLDRKQERKKQKNEQQSTNFYFELTF